ncbi:MAG: Hsp20/alpha crystallin family protein [bacterium]|nr:Hsp20/alpha crystallin family protein [bacterium]
MLPFKNFLFEFDKLDTTIKEIFYDFFSHENPFLMVAETHWRPNVDIYDTPKGIILKLELAGVKQEDISIYFENNKLQIKGHRSDYSIPEKISCQQIEINYGDFERTISLEYYSGLIDKENIKATCKDGMLYVLLPLLEKDGEAARIKIKVNKDK